MGRALALQFDKHVIQEGIIGARNNALVSGLPNGYVLQDDNLDSATLATKAGAFAQALFTSAQKFDENDVPEEGRYAVIRPADYYAIVQNTDASNKDGGGLGAYSDGKVLRVAGINILKSNNVPSTDLSAQTYHGANFAFSNGVRGQTKGLVFHTSAIGTVKLMDLAMESEYEVWRQGTLMVAKYAQGHGWLRPEALIELTGKNES